MRLNIHLINADVGPNSTLTVLTTSIPPPPLQSTFNYRHCVSKGKITDHVCPNGGWNMFLPSASTNSLISVALRTCRHANVSSQTIACANPEPNKKIQI